MRYLILILILFLSACQPIKGFGKKSSFGSTADPSVHMGAVQAYQNGDYKKAEEMYIQLVQASPKNIDYLIGLANSKRNLQDYSGADAQYAAVLMLDPNNADALEGQGLNLLEQGELNTAIQKFTQVMEIDAARWKSLNALGVANALMEHHKVAIEYYQDALALSNDSPAVMNNIALSHAFLRDYRKAADYLNRAAMRLTNDKDKLRKTELNLSLIYGIQGRTAEAEDILRRYFTEPQVYNNLGIYAHLANDNKLARSYINKAIASSPEPYDEAWDTLKRLEKRKK